MVGNQSKTPFYLQFKLFHFIYPHKETYIVIPKVESDNIVFIVPHENPLLFWYCFGSHLWFSGDTPIDLNNERLQAPWRALAFREKALDSTPGARFVEHASGFKLLDTLMLFLKELFEKVNFEKKSADGKQIMKNYPACKELYTFSQVRKSIFYRYIFKCFALTVSGWTYVNFLLSNNKRADDSLNKNIELFRKWELNISCESSIRMKCWDSFCWVRINVYFFTDRSRRK